MTTVQTNLPDGYRIDSECGKFYPMYRNIKGDWKNFTRVFDGSIIDCPSTVKATQLIESYIKTGADKKRIEREQRYAQDGLI